MSNAIIPQLLIDSIFNHTKRLVNYGIIGEYTRFQEEQGWAGPETNSVYNVACEYLDAMMYEENITFQEAIDRHLPALIKAKAAAWAKRIPQIMRDAPDHIIKIIDTDLARAKVIDHTCEAFKHVNSVQTTGGRNYTRQGDYGTSGVGERNYDRHNTPAHQSSEPADYKAMRFSLYEKESVGSPADNGDYNNRQIREPIVSKKAVEEPVEEKEFSYGQVVGLDEVKIEDKSVKYQDHQVYLGRSPLAKKNTPVESRKRSVMLAPMVSLDVLKRAEEIVETVTDAEEAAEQVAKISSHVADRFSYLDKAIVASADIGYSQSIEGAIASVRLNNLRDIGGGQQQMGVCFRTDVVTVMELFATESDFETHLHLNNLEDMFDLRNKATGMASLHRHLSHVSQNADNNTLEHMLSVVDSLASEGVNHIFQHDIGARKAKLKSYMDSFPDAYNHFAKVLSEDVAGLIFGEAVGEDDVVDPDSCGAMLLKRVDCFRILNSAELAGLYGTGLVAELDSGVCALVRVAPYAVMELSIGLSDLDVYLTKEGYNVIDQDAFKPGSSDVAYLFDAIQRFYNLNKSVRSEVTTVLVLADGTKLEVNQVNINDTEDPVDVKLAIRKL